MCIKGNKLQIPQEKKGNISVAQKIIAIYKNKNIAIEINQAKELANITRLRNNFIHDDSKPLVYDTITEPIDTDKGCLEIFNMVRSILRDIG